MPRKESEAWRHFSRIQGSPDSAKCNVCGNVYKRGGGTKNLLDHLRRTHGELLQPGAVAPHNDRDYYEDNNPKKKELDKWLLRLFATDYQPFHMVVDKGFVKLVQAMDPRYKLPTRQTISNKMIPELYNKVKVKVLAHIATAKNVALTTDAWTSQSQDSYLAVTAHYITDGQLKSTCLDCSVLPGHHTAAIIAERIQVVINDWNLNYKICAIVTDNGANMVAAVRLLKLRHLACSAHTLDLVVKDGINATVAIKDLINSCSAIVTFFKQSNIAMEKLKSKRVAANKSRVGLIQQVPTRWNSTLAMIRRLLEVREQLILSLAEMPNGPRTLTAEEWKTLEDLKLILKPFEEMTEMLSGEKYVTASLIIPYSQGLIRKLTEMSTANMTNDAKELLDCITNAAKTRLLNYEQRTVSRGATFLNPRFKKAAFLSANRAEDAQKAIEEEVHDILRKAQGPRTAEATDEPNTPPHTGLLSYLNDRITEHRQRSTSSSDSTILVRQYVETGPIDNSSDPIAYWSNMDAQH